MEKQESSKSMTRRSAVKALAVSPVALLMLAGCGKEGKTAKAAATAPAPKVDYELEVVSSQVFLEPRYNPSSQPEEDLLLVRFDVKNVSDDDLTVQSCWVNAYQDGIKLKMSQPGSLVGMSYDDYKESEQEWFAPGYTHEMCTVYELRDRTTPVVLRSGNINEGSGPKTKFEHTIEIA